MNDQIKEALENCLLCAKRKAHGTRKTPLQPMPVGNYLFERVAMDLVGPVPESRQGNLYILVIGEYVSRYIEAVPLKDQKASTVAQAFLQTIILRHGLLSQILTDQGANFLSEIMQNIYRELGIRQLKTAAYTPRCNGMVEKVNRVLVDMLTMYANEQPESWDEHLPYAVFAYNTSLNATTKEVPFFVVFGRDPIEPSDLKPPNRYRLGDDVWDNFNWNWHRAIEVSKENLKKEQDYQKRRYDATARPISFEVGDSVLLKERRNQTGKFYFRFDGPYLVTRKISIKNYVIKHVGTSQFVVSADRLKKFGRKKEAEQPKESGKEKKKKNSEQGQEVARVSEQSQPETGARPRTKQTPPPPSNEEGRKSKRTVRLPAKLRDPSVLTKY